MEQALAILREYADVIMAVYGGCAVILLLIALHRIRRIEKHMKKLRECVVNAKAAGAQNLSSQEPLQVEQAEQESVVVNTNECNYVNGTKERPEELIDAVLGEIFP